MNRRFSILTNPSRYFDVFDRVGLFALLVLPLVGQNLAGQHYKLV